MIYYVHQTHVKSALKLVDVIAEVDTIGVFTQPVDLSAYPVSHFFMWY